MDELYNLKGVGPREVWDAKGRRIETDILLGGSSVPRQILNPVFVEEKDVPLSKPSGYYWDRPGRKHSDICRLGIPNGANSYEILGEVWKKPDVTFGMICCGIAPEDFWETERCHIKVRYYQIDEKAYKDFSDSRAQ